jgi:hypothetical protein
MEWNDYTVPDEFEILTEDFSTLRPDRESSEMTESSITPKYQEQVTASTINGVSMLSPKSMIYNILIIRLMFRVACSMF